MTENSNPALKSGNPYPAGWRNEVWQQGYSGERFNGYVNGEAYVVHHEGLAARRVVEQQILNTLSAVATAACHQLIDMYAAQAIDAKDAMRYRWLRDKSEPGICAFYLSVGKAFDGVRFTQTTVDDAIDAQIADIAAKAVKS